MKMIRSNVYVIKKTWHIQPTTQPWI